ncbi:MAG: hypothetical protein ACXACW_05175 [Candidatus Hodarchaeales archaeon]|jgi:hypothetical protein
MKAILFTQEDTEGFDGIQQKIHLYLTSKIGVDGFKYSASKWADVSDAFIYENKLCMPIDEREPRYSLILQALTQEEIDLIEEINPNIDIDN